MKAYFSIQKVSSIIEKCKDIALIKHYDKSVSQFENLISCGVISQATASYLEKAKVSLETLENTAKNCSQKDLLALLGGIPDNIQTASRLRDFFLS